jgi:microcystin-dependent protein
MATITGLTADRMLEIEGQSVISGAIVNNHLILTKHDGSTVDAGALPPGPQGPSGPAGGLIPGELRMWPGNVLPTQAEFGKWVWADGATYDVALYPKAAANIAPGWRTFAGASDPPVSLFRVPDLRGVVPAGMDAMPLGARANRVTRSVAIVLAGKTGEETHVITVPEMAAHNHNFSDPGHGHPILWPGGGNQGGPVNGRLGLPGYTGLYNAVMETQALVADVRPTGITVASQGNGAGHENLQPTVFIPYIVKLDD